MHILYYSNADAIKLINLTQKVDPRGQNGDLNTHNTI